MASTTDYSATLARVANCAEDVLSFRATAFRATPPKYANVDDLLSGVGSGKGGGRWNPPGLRAAYLGLTLATSQAELRRAAERFGLEVQELLPQTFCAVEVRLEALLDLSDRRIQRRLKYSYDDMVVEDWWAVQDAGDVARTQFLGHQALECGYEGLIAPSAADRPDGRNLIVFLENLSVASHLRIVNAERLIDPGGASDGP